MVSQGRGVHYVQEGCPGKTEMSARVTAYNNKQQGLLRAALKEHEVLAGGGMEEDVEGGFLRKIG